MIRKILAATATLALLATGAYAAELNDGGCASTVITDLEAGKYYTITAKTENETIDTDAYISANEKKTVIPEGVSTTYIRGVYCEDGTITVQTVSGPGGKVSVTDITAEDGEQYNFVFGGDITEANYITSLGGVYYDRDGNEGDPVNILSQSGVKLARIRLSNSPGKGTGDGDYYLPAGFQDLSDCLELAKRAKENGMQIEFTFNLSDYWSNAERQLVPHEWAEEIKEKLGYDINDASFLKSMSDEQKSEITQMLTEQTKDFVTEVMNALKEQNTLPEYVSIGNEVNGGLLFPFAPSFDMQLNSDNLTAVWDDDQSDDDIPMPAETEALASIMNTAYDAVKAVSPDTAVVLHLANGAKYDSYKWALDIYNNAGTKYDVLGASYYPAWSNNTIEGCKDFCNRIYEEYQLPILIMETGYNWNSTRKDGYPGQLTEIEAYLGRYPPTPHGQKAYIADLINSLGSVNNGACIGAIYWDPLMIHVEDPKNENASLSGWAVRESDDKTDVNVVENSTLFDFDGKALGALDVTAGGAKLVTYNSGDITDSLFASDIYSVSGTLGASSGLTLSNNGSKPETAILYVVSYDDNGVLTGVNTSSCTVDPGASELLYASTNGISTAAYIKTDSGLYRAYAL